MSENTAKRMVQLGAIFYALWGVLHVLAALRVVQLGSTLDVGEIQGKVYQDAWNLGYIALFSVVIAIVFNWRNSRLGYWLNTITISVTDIGFIILLMIPGYSTDILGPILWILGLIFSTIGQRTAPKTT